MILIIGVRFRKSGKVYYFDPAGLDIKKGDHVIVETARGVEYGTVVLAPHEVTDDKVIQPLKPVMRLSTEEDDRTNTENDLKEKEAFDICSEKIKKHGLVMKLIDSEYTFDRNKLLFYFTADGRIDFRDLVKDLAAIFRTRIELRQIPRRQPCLIMSLGCQEQLGQSLPGHADRHMIFRVLAEPGNNQTFCILVAGTAICHEQKVGLLYAYPDILFWWRYRNDRNRCWGV